MGRYLSFLIRSDQECVMIKDLEAFSLLDLSSGDLTVIKINLPAVDPFQDILIMGSIYLPYDGKISTYEFERFIDYCQFNRLSQLLGGDANAYHHV